MTNVAIVIPNDVPSKDAIIYCEPLLAVMSAKFSWIANDLWIAARDADNAKYAIFLPTLAIDANNIKYFGAKGVNNSIKHEISNNNVAKNLQRFGSESNLFDINDANNTPPMNELWMKNLFSCVKSEWK